jgi:hypothetical protein
VADGVHAAVHHVQAPVRDAMSDRATPKPKLHEFCPRDHPGLTGRQRRDRHIDSSVRFGPYVGPN